MHQTFFYKQKLTYSGLNELADDVSDNIKSHDHTEGVGGTGRKLTASGLDDSASPEIRDYDSFQPYVITGLLPQTAGGLTSNITSGEGYAPNDASQRLVRVVRESAHSHTYNASKDTYVYLHPYTDIHGGDENYFHFIETANGAGEPAQPDSTLKLAKVVTNGSQITLVADFRIRAPINSTRVLMENTKSLQLQKSDGSGVADGIGLNSSDELEIGGAKRVLGYAQVTSTQGSITTEVALTGLSVDVTVPTLYGRKVRISFMTMFQSNVAADRAGVNIKEGATYLWQTRHNLNAAGTNYSLNGSVIIEPSSGAHTYNLTGQRATGTGTLSMQAGAAFPAYILVELI